jgi:ceramide glucosyltransferase
MMALLSYLPAAIALAGCGYHLAATVALRRFVKAEPDAVSQSLPPVTVLKPLCGGEPCLLGNLKSFARQDYPRFQIVFGVREADDPALATVAALQGDHPELDMAVVVDPSLHGSNNKVSNLINMMAAARHDVLVISDSDVAVEPDHLKRVVTTLQRPGVGIATCLYTGRASDTPWSHLLAMGMNHAFVPAALVARALGRRDGCFGPTMALHRETLERMGGFAALADRLADDYDLGAAIRARGLTIAVVPGLIDIAVHEPDLSSLFHHELRWERTVALLAPLGHAATVMTQPLPFALLAALISPGGWAVLALAAAARLAVVRLQETAMALAPAPLRLVLAREALSFAVFVAAAAGRSVIWRGSRFRVHRDGTLSACMERQPR